MKLCNSLAAEVGLVPPHVPALLRAHIFWVAELLSKCLLYGEFMDASPQPAMRKYTFGRCGWTSWKQPTNGPAIPKEEKVTPGDLFGYMGEALVVSFFSRGGVEIKPEIHDC